MRGSQIGHEAERDVSAGPRSRVADRQSASEWRWTRWAKDSSEQMQRGPLTRSRVHAAILQGITTRAAQYAEVERRRGEERSGLAVPFALRRHVGWHDWHDVEPRPDQVRILGLCRIWSGRHRWHCCLLGARKVKRNFD